MPEHPLILAFDTSAAQCAAALVSGGHVLAKKSEAMQTGQAERLFPLLEDVLSMAGRPWKDVSLIAVTIGPGNFTGVRIAVSAARGLSLSLGVRAVGVSVFQALARSHRRPVLVLLDARRGRVYAQLFADDGNARDPELTSFEALSGRNWPAGMTCAGFRSAEFAMIVHARAGAAGTLVDPLDVAICAETQPVSNSRPPAPLYLRSADAALPADPPVTILDGA